MTSKIVPDKNFYKEEKTNGTEYKTGKDQRKWSHDYYHKNKEKIADVRRHRFMTDPEYRTHVLKIKKKNDKKQAAREAARRKGVAPYLVEINGELVVVNMCAIAGLANLLGLKKSTINHWLEYGILPRAMYRNKANWKLFTEEQVLYILQVVSENQSPNTRGVNRKVLKEKLQELWKKYPWGFDLDDLEFEGGEE